MSNKEFLDSMAPYDSNKEHWVPDNNDSAEWCLQKIREYKAEKWEKGKFYTEQIAKLNTWLEAATKPLDMNIEHFQNLLQLYADKALEGKKKRAVSLPSGKFGFRKSQPEILRDEAVLLPYCKTNYPDAVKVKESVDWAKLKGRCDITDKGAIDPATGEIIPGVTVTPRPDKFICEVE
nr:MAG TPA_asm: hypothetical protein [Caudoviricetes sp.]